MDSDVNPLKSIMSRGGTDTFPKRDRKVTIQDFSPENKPYSLMRSLGYLNELITHVEQDHDPNAKLYPTNQQQTKYDCNTVDPGNEKLSSNTIALDSPISKLGCDDTARGIRPRSAPRQTDHWMSTTENPRIKHWLKIKDKKAKENLRLLKEESRERFQLTAAIERERIGREEAAKSAYIGWLTNKYKQQQQQQQQNTKRN